MSRFFLKDRLLAAQTILPAMRRNIPASLVYGNAEALGLHGFMNEMMQSRYLAYHGAFEPVLLGRLPADTQLLGGHSFWVTTDGALAQDQISPLTTDVEATFAQLRDLPFPTETVNDPCLLVSRYGDVTWGHWVAEILPRAILAEHAFPGRFRYAVGSHLIGPGGSAHENIGEHGGYASRIRESLAAYGIDETRILPLRPDAHYHFTQLHALTGAWSAGGMNPEVMRLMRETIAPPPASAANGRLAILRRDAPTRTIANHAAIADIMAGHDYLIADLANRPFAEQVALFRDSHHIFGVLGSGLIGLIYAPEHVRVATIAPGAWADTYFHGLIQLRQGWHADIRGPTLWTGDGLERDAPIFAPPAHVQAGLVALATPSLHPRLQRHAGEPILTITFGQNGLGPALLQKGWAAPETNHSWSISHNSRLQLPAPFETENLTLELDVLALTHPQFLPTRQLHIHINGQQTASFAITGQATLSCRLPPQPTPMLDIELTQPILAPARATNHAPDDRPLGIGLLTMRLVRGAEG